MTRRQPHGRTLPKRTPANGLLVLTLLAGCMGGESAVQGPNIPLAVQQALVVSEPVAPPSGPQAVSGATAADSVAFVSLPPGQVPYGEQVTISNRVNGASQTAPVIDGGFDPVAIAAAAGDTLDVVIQRVGLQAFHIILIVPSWRPPIVVRTEPPKRKMDVPLSLAPYVVFSEPMDGATLTPASVRLLRSGELELGTVTRSPDGLRAQFVPEHMLRGETEYVLQVTTAVTDVSGDPLESTYDVYFTTELGPRPVEVVLVRPSDAMLVPGAWVQLSATVKDSSGSILADPMVTWTSSDSAVAIVSKDSGMVQSRVGVPVTEPSSTVTITATSEGVGGSAVITVGRVAFASVQTGYLHTCALTADGRTYCWGHDHRGHLGLGFSPPEWSSCGITGPGLWATCVGRPHAVQTALEREFTSLSLGRSYTCGLATDSAAYCWGENRAGNLGSGWRPAGGISPTPAFVRGGRRYVLISAGSDHACALTAEGEAHCWGLNAHGQLGDGTMTNRSSPVAVMGGHRFSTISSGQDHTCGVALDGTGFCWGSDSLGQLGHNETGVGHPAPVAVAGGLSFTDLSAGWLHTCGLVADDTAYCWGGNAYGQLGDGTTTASATPVPVSGGLAFVSMGASSTHTCALTSSGAVYCWGENSYGQLGDGTTTDSWTPVAVVGGLVFRSLSVRTGSEIADGWSYACGLASDSGVYCWGFGSAGSLGSGWASRSHPVLVIGSR